MRVAIVSREVYPLAPGGIGQFVTAAAQLLSRVAEVTILTRSLHRETYERLKADRDTRLPGREVRLEFVPDPSDEEAHAWYHVMHCYSARVFERLKQIYPEGGPDLIEFSDYLGEGFVTLQAAEALDPFLADTRICVRAHTSAEMCDVLDGFRQRDPVNHVLYEMERYCLARADRVVWQGGDILGTYQRFYGTSGIARPTCIRYPYRGPVGNPRHDRGFTADPPLRILYAGRLERRKGVHNLIRAATGLMRSDFRLTLLGGDTATAPLGSSMRDQLELAVADDARIELRQAGDRVAVSRAITEHHLVVIPSLWECWPYAALEAMHLNRPVLATPVGGMVELVRPGSSGWLGHDTDPVALEESLEAILDARGEVEDLVRHARPLARARALSQDQEILDGYRSLVGEPSRRERGPRRPLSRPPLVSAIVPYYRAARYVMQAIESLFAQTYPRLEILLVNDGSFEEDDWVVAEIAARWPVTVLTQMNQGLGAARNFGVSQSHGRYFFPLDCDNIAEPELIERCVELLEARSDLSYVTSWSRYIEEDGSPRAAPVLGYQPLGNHSRLVAEENVAGDGTAVIRRRIFDAGFRYSEELTSYEDWAFYRQLREAGHLGAVIPERLFRYRVRADSMQAQFAQPLRARLEAEMDALIRENQLSWTSSSA